MPTALVMEAMPCPIARDGSRNRRSRASLGAKKLDQRNGNGRTLPLIRFTDIDGKHFCFPLAQ
jgi:hypothetical protein